MSVIPLPVLLPLRLEGVTASTQIFTQTPLSSPVFHLSAADLKYTHTLMRSWLCVSRTVKLDDLQCISISYLSVSALAGCCRKMHCKQKKSTCKRSRKKIHAVKVFTSFTIHAQTTISQNTFQGRNVVDTERVTKYRSCKQITKKTMESRCKTTWVTRAC